MPRSGIVGSYGNTIFSFFLRHFHEILPLAATWVDLEMIILSEISQTEKDKYHMIALICGI